MHFVVHWGEPVRYVEFYPNVVQSIYRMRGISTVGPDDSGPCVRDNFVLRRNFRNRRCMYTPRCSFWYDCGFHGYVPVVSPACCAVSLMSLDVHVLWRHNWRLSLCCNAPLIGERTSYRVNWVGVAFIKCRRWCHCRLYFCVLPCLTRTMYGFETCSGLNASVTIKFDLGLDLERWGVRIYRIVTGVTSDVGVPSTRLVGIYCWSYKTCRKFWMLSYSTWHIWNWPSTLCFLRTLL